MKKNWVKALIIILVTVGLMGVSLLGVYYVMDEKQKELEKQVLDLEQELNTRYTETELNFKINQSVEEAEEDTRQTMLKDVKEMLLETNSSIKVIRHYYPEDLVVVSGGKFHFLPIRDDLKKHNYDESKLEFSEDGEVTYNDGTASSIKGVDVSQYQGNIDWDKVKADGVEFAFIRTGYRGYKTGKFAGDDLALDNIQGAYKAGVGVGLYFFSQAINEKEAVEEAEWVIDLVKDYSDMITYPIVFDLEKMSPDSARMNALSAEERTKCAIAFLDRIAAEGYTPMLYGNLEMFAVLAEFDKLEAYDKWYAYYDDCIYFPYDFQIWQYSDSGSVDGIPGNVDLDICFTTKYE
jgi:GH25 family lysozyme M1 (1,4-beta-N-acetylmuramidase)